MRKRVLILDDDARVVELMTRVLTRDGLQVEGVNHYEQALASLTRQPADLFISDLNLRGVGGIAGIQALAKRGLVKKAFVVSGYIDPEALVLMSEIPEIVGFLEKPFDILEFSQAIRSQITDKEHGAQSAS